ncbi:Anaphase-promoting complex subunit 2 domain-containing protein [Phanerochaete sordida]|uniref:Anaphase-promoting complex subunit 2 n=1 Tax=Phanerochaete sordida TaxID=48140 RepID=A0A9P3GQN2_9APHY|nr:Anaphase-promoting complex subunit 2 domain-containing protein [Phanerochaete sordida]
MATPALCNQVAEKWQRSFAKLNREKEGITGLLEFTQGWLMASDQLRPRDKAGLATKPQYDKAKLRECFEIIRACNLHAVFLDDYLDAIGRQLPAITNDIDFYMKMYEREPTAEHIANLISIAARWQRAWAPLPEMGASALSAFTCTFQTHLYSILPPSFTTGFRDLISATFDFTSFEAAPQWLLTRFPCPHGIPRPDFTLWTIMQELGLIERYETLILSVCYERIEGHVLEASEKVWDRQMLQEMRDWMSREVVPWLTMPYARDARSAEHATMLMKNVGSRLDYHVCKTLADLRTREIFDIIIDYPDSRPALDDMKECLQRVDQRSQLVQSLRKANRRRLLHPGADTKLILTQYVSIIRCLRIVDPQGVLLFKVADPIRRYLRDRPDTIRCIVASLVGDGESGDSLVDENEPIQPINQTQLEDYTDPNWEPEPMDAGPEFRANKPSDIISTLISIYDSQELFVKELQILLAQRLLAITDGNFDRERRNIEILKIRFGEAALQVCEVMLRDMTDSRRTDQHIQQQKASDLHPTIISRHFWPPLQANTFVMPGQFRKIQEDYASEFHVFKPDKKLLWMSHLGSINLQVELDDRTVEVEVPPLEAAFIELFSEQDEWSVPELVEKVGSIERPQAIKALVTWVELGVLKEDSPDHYRLLKTAEESGSAAKSSGKQPTAVVEELPPVVTVQQQQAEQMRVFWKFIEGMLTNLGQLPLDRIQQMLKFAPNYDRNIDQLAAFMEAARREGLVTVTNGVWKLQRD